MDEGGRFINISVINLPPSNEEVNTKPVLATITPRNETIGIKDDNISIGSHGVAFELHEEEINDVPQIIQQPIEDPSNNDQLESFSPPDGGWGWLVTFSSFLINVIMIGIHNCFGILYMDLVADFQESLSKTAWVGSIAFGCILGFAPISGLLSNKYGCRRVTVFGILIASAFLFASSYATTINAMFVTYGLGFGFGTSLSYMQGAVMVARYFSTKRALASGIGLAGSTIGIFIMAPVYNCIRSAYGWRVALRGLSGLMLINLACAATYRPLRKSGEAPTTVEERIKNSPARKFVFEFSLWKNKAFVIWCMSVGLCKIGYLVPWVHMVKLATDLNLPREFGSSMLQYMGIAATFSRLLAGKIADSPNIKRIHISQCSAFLLGMVNLIQPITLSKKGILAYAIMLGLLDGGVEILLPVMTLDLVGADQLSVAWGCILGVISLSSMGPPIAGAIRDNTGSYLGAFYFVGIPMILSSCVLFLIPCWAQKQTQIPATSFLSIDPSQLEDIVQDGKSSDRSPKHDYFLQSFRNRLFNYGKNPMDINRISQKYLINESSTPSAGTFVTTPDILQSSSSYT